MSSFREKVLKVVSEIPKGKVLTYKKVAELAGNHSAHRAVGNLLSRNCDARIPCHRVIRTDMTPGGYNRGVENKIAILKNEGVVLNDKF